MGVIQVPSITYIKQKRRNIVILLLLGEVGFGKTQSQIKDIAKQVARHKGILMGVNISNGWFCQFIERQPALSLRKSDSKSIAHMSAMHNKEAIENYFKLLKDVLEEHEQFNKPSRIYNIDESGIHLDHCPPHVVVKKGQRKVQ